jgi:hypothetical protein
LFQIFQLALQLSIAISYAQPIVDAGTAHLSALETVKLRNAACQFALAVAAAFVKRSCALKPSVQELAAALSLVRKGCNVLGHRLVVLVVFAVLAVLVVWVVVMVVMVVEVVVFVVLAFAVLVVVVVVLVLFVVLMWVVLVEQKDEMGAGLVGFCSRFSIAVFSLAPIRDGAPSVLSTQGAAMLWAINHVSSSWILFSSSSSSCAEEAAAENKITRPSTASSRARCRCE